jgi:hypothetical protein
LRIIATRIQAVERAETSRGDTHLDDVSGFAAEPFREGQRGE